MFSKEQNEALQAPLVRSHVKKNPRGYDYVEGWHAIAEANRIFGHDGWDRQVIEIRQLGEPEQDEKKNWRVAYYCRVRVTVRADGESVTRDGCGYGSGIVKDVRDAHESAIKEAETDAMKRALMTFGNPFGLALYDKAQTHVIDQVDVEREKFLTDCSDHIAKATDGGELRTWWASDAQKNMRRDFTLTKSELDSLMAQIKAKLETIEGRKTAA